MSLENEKAAIKEVIDGNIDAYKILVERYQKGLYIYLLNMLRDEMLAEDIAQDAFIRAFNKLSSYDPQFSFSKWLYRIARNLAIREYSKNNKLYPVYDSTQIEAKQTDSPEIAYGQRERNKEIQIAISKLKPAYQEVINLYYWNSKSYEEISEILGCPINTVKTWLYRSKELIRKETYGQIG